MTKDEQLLEKLLNPDENGISDWKYREEIKRAGINIGNGCPAIRKTSDLRKKYIIDDDKSLSPGNAIDRIRFKGLIRIQTN